MVARLPDMRGSLALHPLVSVHPIDQRIKVLTVFIGEPHVQESTDTHPSMLLTDSGGRKGADGLTVCQETRRETLDPALE